MIDARGMVNGAFCYVPRGDWVGGRVSDGRLVGLIRGVSNDCNQSAASRLSILTATLPSSSIYVCP